MPLDHTMLSASERMLLEHELMQLAQANQHPFPRNTGFFPTASAAAAALPPLPNNRADLFLGLGNFSNNFLPPAPLPPTNTSSLDAAAAMLLARSQQTAAGRNQISAALGLNYGGGALMQMTPSFNTTGNAAAMTGPGIETLQLECLRAEQELSERRQELERQLEARAAAARQQQQAVAAAAAAQQPRVPPPPPPQPPQAQADLQKLLILQNAACAAQKEPEEELGAASSSNHSSRASSPSSQESSSEDQHHHQQEVAPETNKSADASKPKVSSYSPNRKRAGAGGATPEEKKPKNKMEPGQKNRSKWNSYFEALKEYKKEYGDCCVPRGFSDNPKLASWVAEQRKQYKLYTTGKPNSITLERIELLEGLDFAWRQQEVAWERHKQQLADYFQEYGHCSVPLNHPRYPGLGNWIKQQRRLYKRKQKGMPENQLPEERIQALAELGFDWNSTHKRGAKKTIKQPKTSDYKRQKPRVWSGKKRQKPMISTSFKRTAPAEPSTKHRAVERSNSNDSLPFKKRRRADAVEV